MAARTTIADLPDSIDLSEFNLQEHLDLLCKTQESVTEWSL